MRMGDTDQECSVALLRQLFYPRSTPSIRLRVKALDRPPHFKKIVASTGPHGLKPNEPESLLVQQCVNVSVVNVGSWTIHDVVMSIKCGDALLTQYSFVQMPVQSSSYWHLEMHEGPKFLSKSVHPGVVEGWNLVVVSKGSLPAGTNWDISVFARDLAPLRGRLPHELVIRRPWSPIDVVPKQRDPINE